MENNIEKSKKIVAAEHSQLWIGFIGIISMFFVFYVFKIEHKNDPNQKPDDFIILWVGVVIYKLIRYRFHKNKIKNYQLKNEI